jgi:hypothetical protein
MKYPLLFLIACLLLVCPSVSADEVKVIDAVAKKEIGFLGETYLFIVTLEHNDEGWNHFADRWEIWTQDGNTLLGTRKLAHPHVDEQPFTRSLSGVEIPEGAKQVLIRAHDTIHEDSPHTFIVTLPEPG